MGRKLLRAAPRDGAIEAAKLHGLGHVRRADATNTLEVGDGAGELEDAVVRARRKPESLHRTREQRGSVARRPAQLAQRPPSKLGVGVHASEAAESLPLPRARRLDADAYR